MRFARNFSISSRVRGTPWWPRAHWCPPTTPPCCLPTAAWCSSRTSSSAGRHGPMCGPLLRSAACGPVASTTTWKTWATPPATTPSLRCWAISRLATTSSARRSLMPGACSRRSISCPPKSSGSPSTRKTMRLMAFGRTRSACRRPASFGLATTRAPVTPATTSGRWPTRAPAALAAKSSTTTAPMWPVGHRAHRMKTATATSRSGTWSSCSTTVTRPGCSTRCRARAWTRAWALSALPRCSRACTAITRSTSSRA